MRARAALAARRCSRCWLGAGCGGSKRRAFRIGILSDCYGPFSAPRADRRLGRAAAARARRQLRGKQAVERHRGRQGRRPAGRARDRLRRRERGRDPGGPPAGRGGRRAGGRRPARPAAGARPPRLRAQAPGDDFLIQPTGAPELTLTTRRRTSSASRPTPRSSSPGSALRLPRARLADGGDRRRRHPLLVGGRAGLRRRVLRPRRPDRRPRVDPVRHGPGRRCRRSSRRATASTSDPRSRPCSAS